MIKGLMLLADGFEQTEAFTTHDVLARTRKIQLDYVSVSDDLVVRSSHGVEVNATSLLEDIDIDEYDFLVLPGGKEGVANLKSTPKVLETIEQFHAMGKKYFAICAAPSILGELGLLDGKNYTCFPGFQKGNGTYINKGSVIDGDLVTGHSMAYTIDFASDIIRVLLDEEELENIQNGIKGL